MSPVYRFLFLPVSAARGTGEYARALEIASAALARWPDADIRFMVSREAPYARSVPFKTILLERSSTLQPREVAETLREFRPQIVVFDNAGRTTQLRVAREIDARVLYVSSRPRQRGKAFRWRWMRLIDEHWIAYPALLAGSLSRAERFKLLVMRRPTVRFLDVLLPSVGATTAAILARYGVASGEFVLVAPGGGAAHRSLPQAPAVIAAAVRELAARVPAVVWVGEVPSTSLPDNVKLAGRVPMAELVALAGFAKVVLTNGADTLLQVIALARPCVAIALSPDQTARLQRLTDAGVPVDVALDSSAIVAAVESLYCDADAAAANVAKLRTLSLRDGLAEAIDAIERLLKKEAMQ
ncbi:MAG: hypothetical protein IPG25_11450 [Proteobacteria bacterium]|nr:hypothetical protein [Pseudomonadota bacterium]